MTLEQKMDILRRYDRGESTAAIRNSLNLPEFSLRTIRKDREKITAAIKTGADNCSTKVLSAQSNIMVRIEKMLVTWMNHRRRQGLNVTFDDTKNKMMECFSYMKEKETGPLPDFSASMSWYYKFRHTMASIESSAWERPRASTRIPLLCSQSDSRPSSRRGVTSPSRSSTRMKRACSGRRCLNAHTSRGRRGLPRASKRSGTVSPSCWGLT